MKIKKVNYLLRYFIIFVISFSGKGFMSDGYVNIEGNYFTTKQKLIIHDWCGAKYSILPAKVALYPVINMKNEFIMFVNYQPLIGELKTLKNTDANGGLSKLYLSKMSMDFINTDHRSVTKNDLVHLLHRNTLTKNEFAEVLSVLEE